MNKPGLLVRNILGTFRWIRFLAGSLLILILLSTYCLNVSHYWKEGVGALPNQHVGWLPASAFQSGSIQTLTLGLVLLIACAVAMHLRRRQVEILLTIIIAIATITSLITIGQRLAPRPFPVFDLTGFFPYENHFSMFANLALPVALAMGERWRIRAFQRGNVSSPAGLFFCAAGLMVAAVALSGSRAGLLLSILITGVWILLQGRLHCRYPQTVLLQTSRIVQVARTVAILALIPALIYLASQFHKIGRELSFRGQTLKDTLDMWLDNPFWGTGPGSFAAVFPYYQSLPQEEYFFRHAHCEPLQFLAEYGLLGCLGVLVGISLIWFSSRCESLDAIIEPPVRELEGAGLCLALAGVGLHSLIDFPFRHPLIALLTVIWIGILATSFQRLYCIGANRAK